MTLEQEWRITSTHVDGDWVYVEFTSLHNRKYEIPVSIVDYRDNKWNVGVWVKVTLT